MNTVILTALAEPNRLRFVELSRHGPRPVGDLLCGFGCASRINMYTCAFFAQPAFLMCGRSLSGRFNNLDLVVSRIRQPGR
jgi:hypothetical protein